MVTWQIFTRLHQNGRLAQVSDFHLPYPKVTFLSSNPPTSNPSLTLVLPFTITAATSKGQKENRKTGIAEVGRGHSLSAFGRSIAFAWWFSFSCVCMSVDTIVRICARIYVCFAVSNLSYILLPHVPRKCDSNLDSDFTYCLCSVQACPSDYVPGRAHCRANANGEGHCIRCSDSRHLRRVPPGSGAYPEPLRMNLTGAQI